MEATSKTPHYDVIIIGGGISGLTAAYNIKKKYPGASVLVLEANDRVGGRTLTVPLKGASGLDKWDLGGQWVGKCQTHVMNLLKDLRLDTFKQYTTGRSLQQIGGRKVESYTGTIPPLSVFSMLELQIAMWKTDYYQQQLDVYDPCSHPRAAEWDAITVAHFYNKTLYTQAAKETFQIVIRSLYGIEADQISFLYFLLDIRQAGGLSNVLESDEGSAQGDKIQLGAQQISLELVSRIGSEIVRLNEAVTSISQTDTEGVTVVTKSGWTGVASRVILAMPPKAVGTIRFEPRMPEDRMDFMDRMPMGNIIKIIITYETSFWRSRGYSGLAVSSGFPLSDDDDMPAPLSAVIDGTSCNGNPALVGFICGQIAIDWAAKPVEERKKAVLYHLAFLFKSDALTCVDYKEQDWNLEPFSFGGPSGYMGVGGMTNHARAIMRVEGRLHFAGSETATAWTGYMSGAVQAGERTAVEVLSHLAPNTLSDQDRQLLEELDNARKRLAARKTQRGGRSILDIVFSIGFGVAVVVACIAMYSAFRYR